MMGGGVDGNFGEQDEASGARCNGANATRLTCQMCYYFESVHAPARATHGD